jgi:hypothetical protein
MPDDSETMREKGERVSAELKPGFDGNPPEFAPTRDIESIDRVTGRRVREHVEGPTNINTSRIRWLYERGYLGKRDGARRYAAAEAYVRDYERSLLLPVASIVPGGAGGGNSRRDYHPNDAKLAAMMRHAAARSALGRWLGVVDLIVLENKTLPQAAQLLGGIHQERVSDRLETGLDILADFYEIVVREEVS